MATELLSYDENNLTRRSFVRDGIAGNLSVVREMIRITRHSVNYDFALESLVKKLLIENKLSSHSKPEKIFALIYEYIKDAVAYINDLAGSIESLKSPRRTLADGFGDCDDHAICNAAFLGVLGFEDVRFALAKYLPSDRSFVHIYTVCYLKGKRYVFDTTLPRGKVGMEVKASEVKEIPIFNDAETLAGISGVADNTKYFVKKLAKSATEALPAIATVLPLGFLSSSALSTGATLINQTWNTELSLAATASKINAELDKLIVGLHNGTIALDLANSLALQLAAQINTANINTIPHHEYTVIRDSIKRRVDFIKNFAEYAREHDLTTVRLNPKLMLGVGAIGIGYAAYKFFKRGV